MLATQGFEIIDGVLTAENCATLGAQIAPLGTSHAGSRNLLQHSLFQDVAAQLSQHPKIKRHLAAGLIPVQCTYFEKSTERNWLVTWHQDLSIPVAEFMQHDALHGWSEKQGGWYVQAPRSLLAQCLAVRLHLDACEATDGALNVLPGSHQTKADMPNIDLKNAEFAKNTVQCCATQGAAMLMRPLLWHASSKATGHSQRRVLHYLFAPAELPYGLRWPARQELNL